MSTAPVLASHPAGGFVLAHAVAEHWGSAAKSCLAGLGPAVAGATMGVIYATEPLADDLPSILTFLRETTRIPHWIGAAAPGICFEETEIRRSGALAVMVGRLPEAGFSCFSGLEAKEMAVTAQGLAGGAAIVHGDPRNPAVPALVEALASAVPSVAGGLVSGRGPPSQLSDAVLSGGISGLLLGPEVPLVVGLTQGCTPIGPVHTITDCWEGVVMALDDRPALEVLKEEAGELIARDLKRAAGYIHVALPVAGAEAHDYQVRTLVGIDPRQGWLAVSERLAPGQRVMFVRRDANAARADLARMLGEVRTALDGRRALAAFYFTCVARGEFMFGEEGAEIALVKQAVGDAPLIGLFANGEVAGGRLYGYTGVLAVIAGDAG